MTAPEDRLWSRLNDAFSDCSEAELAHELEEADRVVRYAPEDRLTDLEIEATVQAVRERVFQEPRPIVAIASRRRRPWIAAAVIVGLLVAGWWLLRSDTGPSSEAPLRINVAWLRTPDDRLVEYRARQMIVQLDEGTSPESLGQRFGMRLIDAAPVPRTFLFEHEPGEDVASLLTGLQNDRDVLWAEPNFLVRTSADRIALASEPRSERSSDERSAVAVTWIGASSGQSEAEAARRAIHEVAPLAELTFEAVVDDDGIGDVFHLVNGLHQAWTRGARVVQLGVSLESPSELLTQAVRIPVNDGVVVIAASTMFTRDIGNACPQSCDWLAIGDCDESTGAPLIRTPSESDARLAALAGYAAHFFAVDPHRNPREVAACLRRQLEENPNCLVHDRTEGDPSNLICMDT